MDKRGILFISVLAYSILYGHGSSSWSAYVEALASYRAMFREANQVHLYARQYAHDANSLGPIF